jgi:hypothetical protein
MHTHETTPLTLLLLCAILFGLSLWRITTGSLAADWPWLIGLPLSGAGILYAARELKG